MFCKKLSSQLHRWGFIMNPYHNCVMNKVVDGKQCTTLWRVDDLKISHVYLDVVNNVIEKLESMFGKEAPLTITRGKIHEYLLGMTIDFNEIRKVKFTTVDYIKEMLEELPEEMDGIAPTPAASHLFEVNEAAKKLSTDAAKNNLYHHNAAKLIFLCKRASQTCKQP